METLARAARRGKREPVLEAVGEPVTGKHRREIPSHEAVREVLEGEAHVGVGGRIALEEEGLERAVARRAGVSADRRVVTA